MSIKSSVHYLAELSGLSKSKSIFNHLKSISGLSSAKNKTDCLAEITQQPKGKEQVWYYRIWAGLTGSESIQYCLSVLASFIPPQLSSVIQWIDDKWTAVYNFDGVNYITVNKMQTITSEWTCLYRSKFIDKTPLDIERLYENNNAFEVRVLSGGNISYLGNGAPSTVTSLIVDSNEESEIEIYVKSNGIKILLKGEEHLDESFTYTVLTSTEFKVSSPNTGRDFTGLMFNFGDCQETWTAPSLTGSQGTIAVATDPNNTLNAIEYSQDKSENGSYALKEVATGDVNLNPTDNATLITKGNLNEFINPEELNAKHDLTGLDPIATRNLPNELDPATAKGVIIVWDGLAEELTVDEKAKTNKHMGRL